MQFDYNNNIHNNDQPCKAFKGKLFALQWFFGQNQ